MSDTDGRDQTPKGLSAVADEPGVYRSRLRRSALTGKHEAPEGVSAPGPVSLGRREDEPTPADASDQR